MYNLIILAASLFVNNFQEQAQPDRCQSTNQSDERAFALGSLGVGEKDRILPILFRLLIRSHRSVTIILRDTFICLVKGICC